MEVEEREAGVCRAARLTLLSYSNKGAIIGGVAAGAAAIGGLLYWKHHNRAKLQGCVSGNGDKLVSEKDNRTYSLTNVQNDSLKSGERVELLGRKATNETGAPTFAVPQNEQGPWHVYGVNRDEPLGI